MHFSRKAERALGFFRQAAETDRFPHAILIAGHPRGGGLWFAEAVLGLLFRVKGARLHKHVDIQFIEPESKARQIRVEAQIRPFISFIGLTSYEGGWKAGVILFADRMNASAQNALLKTLEEPPMRTVVLLVTEIPGAILSTVRSRSYYVDVRGGGGGGASWEGVVMDLLRHPPARRPLEIQAWADRLAKPLMAIAEGAEADEAAAEQAAVERDPNQPVVDRDTVAARVASRVQEAQDEIFRVVQSWQRDLAVVKLGGAPLVAEKEVAMAQARGLTLGEMVGRVRAVDEARARVAHHVQLSSVLYLLARDLAVGER